MLKGLHPKKNLLTVNQIKNRKKKVIAFSEKNLNRPGFSPAYLLVPLMYRYLPASYDLVILL